MIAKSIDHSCSSCTHIDAPPRIRIGYANPGYPVIRNIINKVPECEYVRCRSFRSMIEKGAKALHLPQPKLGCAFIGGTKTGKIELLHLFNDIVLSPCKKPYVTTFETSVPRSFPTSGWLLDKARESLTSARCRRLIALSECAANRQRAIFNGWGELDAIKKITVIHPPQPLLTTRETIERKFEKQDPLKIIFVGTAFFRKGGSELIKAALEIRKHSDVRLIIIGNPRYVDYMMSDTCDKPEEICRMIRKNAKWIEFHESLNNAATLDLMRTCHVGCLPTRADTYGFSVLEMQAAGLPCITTDVRALPEINSDACGWMIHVKQRSDGEAEVTAESPMESLSEAIQKGIVSALSKIVNDRDGVRERALESFARIQKFHDPVLFGDSLRRVYHEALGMN